MKKKKTKEKMRETKVQDVCLLPRCFLFYILNKYCFIVRWDLELRLCWSWYYFFKFKLGSYLCLRVGKVHYTYLHIYGMWQNFFLVHELGLGHWLGVSCIHNIVCMFLISKPIFKLIKIKAWENCRGKGWRQLQFLVWKTDEVE